VRKTADFADFSGNAGLCGPKRIDGKIAVKK
jgi:hypothetical protein